MQHGQKALAILVARFTRSDDEYARVDRREEEKRKEKEEKKEKRV